VDGVVHFTELRRQVYVTPVLHFPDATALLCVSNMIFSPLPRVRCSLSFRCTWRIFWSACFVPTT
jgi:hypothetical protein